MFADNDLKETFEKLRNEDEKLFKEIENALDKIRQNAFFGRNVRKNLIPKELKDKYKIDNLWVYNLSKDWRLFYAITK